MDNEKLIELFKQIGLSENESKIYLVALSLGSTTILKLSQHSTLPRTTVYHTVETLKQKGLMRINIEGFKKKYEAESPEKLEIVLEERKNTLHKKLPELMSLYNLKGHESVIKYYEGLEAVKGIYTDTTAELRTGDFFYVISDIDKLFALDRPFFENNKKKLASLHIDAKIFGLNKTPMTENFIQYEKNYNHVTKNLPPETSLAVDIMITPYRVVIVQLDLPLLGIVIQNQSVITAHKESFKIMWRAINN